MKRQQRKDKKTFTAHVWSPINNGEAILKMTEGTTAGEMLDTLSGVWGAQFRSEAGMVHYEHYVAAWCVLCRDSQGVYRPLGIKDVIPTRSPERDEDAQGGMSSVFEEIFHDFRQGWRSGRFTRSRLDEPSHWIERSLASLLEGGKPRGLMITGPSARPRQEHLDMLASGPKPSRAVDLELAVVIAVSGT
jgi:hypothetical protein